MLEHYLGSSLQFLDTVKCYLCENYLSYVTVERVFLVCNIEIVPTTTTTNLNMPRLVPIDS